MITLSEENYLKAIYHLERQMGGAVSTNAIADKMETKASSVTDMVKKLADKDYIIYKKYQGVSLTAKGNKTAANVVRKHRLWEVFLVEKLNFSWDEVHDVAEQLEHIKSPKLINELDVFLEFPTHDPHGDPIPDKDGNISKLDKISLSKVALNDLCTCVGVIDSSAEFLKYLDKHKIALGTQIKVIEKESFDESMTIVIHNSELNISKTVANNIYVKTH
ncbi:metal-dependent transcriptional regulator [Winogradskyella sp. KYW1333]|jgi:DtxR family Mn-dependent transcriptional regulator|uniref:metal-dependent transcriptional regulator n=1 Tax=unclassified Winogradskyella TaxID=2615021 RepID=UPI000DF1690C|nr:MULTISPECIES: metal-dependent transcriptional regulator [unclassified Winogradskyella]MDB4752203.1 metal-dependent transcriptional regulator [Winogradskyella sp.]RCT53726.1 metal-dependent transcriptional regulator [Winogradskyella sp. KYW1333]